ncbi:MAG: pyridoxamine 5'-phosphate oxidase family protein [Proteobacteria bacterium]|nr:pyridoxamine 5'-phosphate oxidase family protein [Pseudomonadota bacterium]MDA1037771.1 pyridoxamine 5'-phosphate oxidase family protein [Pseudomonadota bacterium]
MIEFISIATDKPFQIFKNKYDEALIAGQKNIEAISISSYNSLINEVDSRYVNLKFIKNNEFIFFSNYKSPKAISFNTHSQIAALFYWSNINIQIRIKANIIKTSNDFNQKYFFNRSEEKNALAISSNQSRPIDSYSQVEDNYNNSLNNDDLKKCPEYWGGYSFIPYYFEFWVGHESRINKREVFNMTDSVWNHSFLQP